MGEVLLVEEKEKSQSSDRLSMTQGSAWTDFQRWRESTQLSSSRRSPSPGPDPTAALFPSDPEIDNVPPPADASTLLSRHEWIIPFIFDHTQLIALYGSEMSEPGIDVTTLHLSAIKDRPTLTELLSLLFEPTPALRDVLVPDVLARLDTTTPESYDELIDLCADAAGKWTWDQKAEFIQGHPMIGAPKVTGLSGKEQGGGPVTPQVVLDRYVAASDSLFVRDAC